MFDKISLKINKIMKKNEQEQLFKRNRYIKEDILAAFENIETINETMNLDITSNDTLEIHLDDKDGITRDLIKEIIGEIPEFDNCVQDFCEFNYKESSFNARNYMVILSWISIDQNKVIMRYWGEFVNIELEAIFVKNNLVWENKDMYFC